MRQRVTPRRWIALPRASRGVVARWLLLAVVVFVSFVSSRAQAVPSNSRRLVFYVEATGIDVASVRARVRDSIPENVVVVDTDEFRAAMTAKGQKGPVGQAYATPAERGALFERIRQSATETHADGAVIVLMFDTQKVRIARLIVLYAGEQEPALDEILKLEPAKAQSDASKIHASLGPILEAFAKVPPPVEPTPLPTNPIPPTILTAPPADTTTPPVAGPPSKPPVTGQIALRTFPAGGAANFATVKITVPVTKDVALAPLVGAGYVPKPADDQAYILGAGIRLGIGGGWNIEPAFVHARFPKLAAYYRGGASLSGAFDHPTTGPSRFKMALTAHGTRWLWQRDLGAPGSEAWEVFGQLELWIRPIKQILFQPVMGYFIYDRSIVGSKGSVGALAFTYAPYPLQTFFGGNIGFDTGKVMPYISAKHYLYTANIGIADAVALGLRVAFGTDYADLRVGAFVSDTHGPLSNPNLDVLPAVNLDLGWAF